MKQPYIGSTKISKLYKGNELWCNWSSGSGGGSEPIMDGLVCWLDARDYINGSTIWNDRSGLGNNGTLSNTNGVLSNSGLLFEGQVLVNNVTKNLVNFTIIIHYKIKTDSFWSSVFGNTGGSNGLSMFNSRKDEFGIFGKADGSNFEKKFTYTINNEDIISVIVLCVNKKWLFYINNISNPLSDIIINPTDADYMNLCCRKANNSTATSTDFADSKLNEWYSFKFYNRVLTEDEIKHNLAYEEENGRNLYFDYENVTMGDEPITDGPGEMSKGGTISE